MDKIQEQVWGLIQEMNRKWTIENKVDELIEYFHNDMVAIVPTESKRIEGGKNCIAGWKEFTENAIIHYWRELEPKVQIYGNEKFAIVTYYFDMSFDMDGRTIVMKGRDMFSLVKEKDKWLIVADQFSSDPYIK